MTGSDHVLLNARIRGWSRLTLKGNLVLYSIKGVSLSDDSRRGDGVRDATSVIVRDAYGRPCQPQRSSHEDRERQVQASSY